MVAYRALVLGDYARAPYHPLHAIEHELRSILGDSYELEFTDDYSVLGNGKLNSSDLFICYTDCWKFEVSNDQIKGLQQHIRSGGKLLILHSGISLQVREEFSQMVGAQFTGHPPYQLLPFNPIVTDRPIVQGIEPFSLEEEPYLFELHAPEELTVLMEYTLDGEAKPAAWTSRYGEGSIVYLMPGHHAASFQHPSYRTIVLNSANWLCSQQ